MVQIINVFQNGKVHFESKYNADYGLQEWHQFRQHKQGAKWLTTKLKKAGVNVSHWKRPSQRKKVLKTHSFEYYSQTRGKNPSIKSIKLLYKRYLGQDIYIFASGPSIFNVNPEDFKEKICMGINYTFEVIPFLDYILVHEIETYESIKNVVDNEKLLLSELLFRHSFLDKSKVKGPPHIYVKNNKAYIYPIQYHLEKDIDKKQLSLDRDAKIFTWSTTTHSAIHLAAYMGAKNIYLIGVDYTSYEDGRVHFDSKHSEIYGEQKWSAFHKHRQGDKWLAGKLSHLGVSLFNISSQFAKPKTKLKLKNIKVQGNEIRGIRPLVFGKQFF